MPTLTTPIIEAAIAGFELQREKLAEEINQLRAMLNGGPEEAAAPSEAPTRSRKKFSAATRQKMALAQKARWANKGGSETTPEGPKKRKMSAAGRKAIAEAQRKRWAASKKQSESAKTEAKATKPKRKLSAAGRKAISDATKKRWATKMAAAQS
jgi:hypothetical protein